MRSYDVTQAQIVLSEDGNYVAREDADEMLKCMINAIKLIEAGRSQCAYSCLFDVAEKFADQR